MMTLIEQAGWGAYPTLIFTAIGLVVVLTAGRKSGRPGSFAAAWTAVILASGAMGFGSGTISVDKFIEKLPPEKAASAATFVAVGIHESATNFLLAGMGGLLVMAVGGVLALAATRKSSAA